MMDPNTKTEIRIETWGDKHFMVRAGNYSLTAKVISKAKAHRLRRKQFVRTDWPPKWGDLGTFLQDTQVGTEVEYERK